MERKGLLFDQGGGVNPLGAERTKRAPERQVPIMVLDWGGNVTNNRGTTSLKKRKDKKKKDRWMN